MELQQDQNLKNVKHSDQKVRLHLDRKGGGKIVTVVKGLSHDDETMNELAKELKKKCGTGGSPRRVCGARYWPEPLQNGFKIFLFISSGRIRGCPVGDACSRAY